MPITQSQSYSSNFGNDFTNTLNVASVAAVAGDAILASYTFRATDPQIASAPTWNGQTLSLVHTSSDTSKTVYIYGVVASATATATLTAAPTNWTYAAALVKVATGNVAPTSTFITPIVKFEDSTNTPWSSPSNSVTGVATGDILVDFLFASDQDSGGNDLTGQVFTPGAGQTNGLSVNNSASHYVGNISSSIKSGSTGTVSTSYGTNLQPVYVYVTTGIRAGISGPTLDSINSGTVLVGSTGNTVNTTSMATLISLTVGGKSATSLSATGGDGTFSMPSFVDGTTYSLMGSVTATANDGVNTADKTITLSPMTGFSYVTLAGTLNTSSTGGLYNFSPAAVVNDQIVYETANITYDAQGNITSSFTGTQTAWHIQASTGITRSYSIITGVPSLTINGVFATGVVGTVVPQAGANPTISDISATGNKGTIFPSAGASVAVNGVSAQGVVGSIFTTVVKATTSMFRSFLNTPKAIFRKIKR